MAPSSFPPFQEEPFEMTSEALLEAQAASKDTSPPLARSHPYGNLITKLALRKDHTLVMSTIQGEPLPGEDSGAIEEFEFASKDIPEWAKVWRDAMARALIKRLTPEKRAKIGLDRLERVYVRNGKAKKVRAATAHEDSWYRSMVLLDPNYGTSGYEDVLLPKSPPPFSSSLRSGDEPYDENEAWASPMLGPKGLTSANEGKVRWKRRGAQPVFLPPTMASLPVSSNSS